MTLLASIVARYKAARLTWNKTPEGYERSDGAAVLRKGRSGRKWELVLPNGRTYPLPKATFDAADALMVKLFTEKLPGVDFKQIGAEAFAAGKSRVPAHDIVLMKALQAVSGGLGTGSSEVLKAMKEWTKGWDQANLRS